MLIVHLRAIERCCYDLLERDIRIRWYEGVVRLMAPHQTLSQFLRSRAGKRFRRRSAWVLQG
jgi:hypothetical protein